MSAFPLFATRMRAARGRRKWSQVKLAEITAIHPSQISWFESGARDPGTANLIKLADALDVTMDWLIGRAVAERRGK